MSIDVLEKSTALLKNEGIKHWVMGGYALDICVGRITREHSNVDLLIKLVDSGKAKSVLEDDGWFVDLINDKLRCRKNNQVLNLILMDDFRNYYIISLINVEVKIPKALLNHEVINELDGVNYSRIPNELIYLFMKYSLNQKDKILINNLRIDKGLIKAVKIDRKRLI